MKKNYSVLPRLYIRALAFILIACQAVNTSLAQPNENISISIRNVSLDAALKQVEQKGKIALLYNYDEVSKVRNISFEATNAKLHEVLERLLEGTGFTYKISDNTVVISLVTVRQPIGGRRVVGTVVDFENHKPLIGVTVMVKGTSTGTVTDANGNYNITFPATGGPMLVFSYIGYGKREIHVGNETVVNVSLTPNSTQIEDVVIETGYQTLSAREITGSFERKSFEELDILSRSSIDAMLGDGLIPGLVVTNLSGEAGATPKIRIRGTSSIVGTRAPLWVLDGIILEDPVNMNLTDLNAPDAEYLVGNAIAGVNPRDIESITVLKDASATALYGSRAANGVIVVTTKKGKVGKPVVSFSSNLSMNLRPSYGDFNLMNAGERIELSQEIVSDQVRYSRYPAKYGYEGLLLDYYNGKYSYDEFVDAVNKMAKTNTDWYDLLFRNSFTQNYTVSLSGGHNMTTYYSSLGYSKELATAKSNDSERLSAMVKVNSWLNDKLYIGFQVNTSRTNNNGYHSSTNPFNYAYETSRTIPCYNDDGSLYYYNTQQKSQTAILSAPKEELLYNILNEMNLTGATGDVTSLTAKVDVQYNITSSIRYKLTGSLDHSNTNKQDFAQESSNYVSMIRRWNVGTLVPGTKDFDDSVIPIGGILSNTDQRMDSYTLRNSIEFNKILNQKHLVSAFVLQEINTITSKGLSQTQYGWQPDRGRTVAPAITSAYVGIIGSLRPTITDLVTNTVSYLGNITYAYKDILTLNGKMSMDGSNKFGDNPAYRFLPIWAVSGKYTFTNEPYMQDNKWIRHLAVRMSYGISGNVDKSSSPDLIIRVGSKNTVTGLNESSLQYLPNPDLRWEETRSLNMGLDFSLIPSKKQGAFLDVVSGSVDVYDKEGHAIIVNRNISQVMGVDQVKINAGRIRNRGIEGSLCLVPYQTEGFYLSFTATASYNKNKLLEANKDIGVTNEDKLSGNALIEGMPVGGFYSYTFAGLNPKWGFPMFYSTKTDMDIDENGDPIPGTEHQAVRYELYQYEQLLTYSGTRDPKVDGSLTIASGYKGFSASLSFNYRFGGVDRLPNVYRQNYYAVFDPMTNVPKSIIDRWRKPGDEQHTNIPVIYDNDLYALAKNEMGIPMELNSGSAKTPLELYDRSTARVARNDIFKLSTVNLAYRLPASTVSRLGLESASIRMQMTNLFWLADKAWEGADPSSAGSRTPVPRSFSLGLSIGF